MFRSILAACVVTAAVGVKRCMRKACAGHSVGMRRAMFEGDPSCTRCSCVVLCRFVVSVRCRPTAAAKLCFSFFCQLVSDAHATHGYLSTF